MSGDSLQNVGKIAVGGFSASNSLLKAIVTVSVVILLGFLTVRGAITGRQALDFLTAFLTVHALHESAAALKASIAARRTSPPSQPSPAVPAVLPAQITPLEEPVTPKIDSPAPPEASSEIPTKETP